LKEAISFPPGFIIYRALEQIYEEIVEIIEEPDTV
jgi:hypothetical protein